MAVQAVPPLASIHSWKLASQRSATACPRCCAVWTLLGVRRPRRPPGPAAGWTPWRSASSSVQLEEAPALQLELQALGALLVDPQEGLVGLQHLGPAALHLGDLLVQPLHGRRCCSVRPSSSRRRRRSWAARAMARWRGVRLGSSGSAVPPARSRAAAPAAGAGAPPAPRLVARAFCTRCSSRLLLQQVALALQGPQLLLEGPPQAVGLLVGLGGVQLHLGQVAGQRRHGLGGLGGQALQALQVVPGGHQALPGPGQGQGLLQALDLRGGRAGRRSPPPRWAGRTRREMASRRPGIRVSSSPRTGASRLDDALPQAGEDLAHGGGHGAQLVAVLGDEVDQVRQGLPHVAEEPRRASWRSS